ncbi:MAG TPA: hypothetical protein VGS08_00230, partial [Candidatus Saccharimonadales bacterium]|nr:hypothetical protein [Candidatus Saccharimonadales bacterium]
DPQHETDGSETGGIEAGATVEEQDISTGPTDPNPTLSLLRTTAVVDTSSVEPQATAHSPTPDRISPSDTVHSPSLPSAPDRPTTEESEQPSAKTIEPDTDKPNLPDHRAVGDDGEGAEGPEDRSRGVETGNRADTDTQDPDNPSTPSTDSSGSGHNAGSGRGDGGGDRPSSLAEFEEGERPHINMPDLELYRDPVYGDWLSADLRQQIEAFVADVEQPPRELTEREKAVVSGLANGYTAEQIARQIQRHRNTVDAILKKLRTIGNQPRIVYTFLLHRGLDEAAMPRPTIRQTPVLTQDEDLQFFLAAAGFSIKEIMEGMGISQNSVQGARARIMKRFGAEDMPNAIGLAFALAITNQ